MRQLGAIRSGGRCWHALGCTKHTHGRLQVEVILHTGLLLADLREAGWGRPHRGRKQAWQGGCCLAGQYCG